MMLQLNSPLWVTTPLGEGFALLVIDYGPYLNSIWVVHLFADGQLVHIESNDIRVMGNDMYGIRNPEQPRQKPAGQVRSQLTADELEALEKAAEDFDVASEEYESLADEKRAATLRGLLERMK